MSQPEPTPAPKSAPPSDARISPELTRARDLWRHLEKPVFSGPFRHSRDLKACQDLIHIMKDKNYADLDPSGKKDATTMQAEVRAAMIDEAQQAYRMILMRKENKGGFNDYDIEESKKRIAVLLGIIAADYSVLGQPGESDKDVKNNIKQILKVALLYTIRDCLLPYYITLNPKPSNCFANSLPAALRALANDHEDVDYRLCDPHEKIPSAEMKKIIEDIQDRKPSINVIGFMVSRFYRPGDGFAAQLASVFATQLDQLNIKIADIPEVDPASNTDNAFALLDDIIKARIERFYAAQAGRESK